MMPGGGSRRASKRSGGAACSRKTWDFSSSSSSDDSQCREKKKRTVARVSNVNEKAIFDDDDGDSSATEDSNESCNDKKSKVSWFARQVPLVATKKRTVVYSKKYTTGLDDDCEFAKVKYANKDGTNYTLSPLDDGDYFDVPREAIVAVMNCMKCIRVQPSSKTNRCKSCPRTICDTCLGLEASNFIFHVYANNRKKGDSVRYML